MEVSQPERWNGKKDDKFKRFLVKIAWIHVVIFLVMGLVATWFQGLRPEIILSWIVFPFLCALMLLTAYDVRRTILVVGLFLLAGLLVGASFLHDENWSVGPGQLQDWAIGAVGFAAWLLVWDKRKQGTYPFVAQAAGILAFAGLFLYGVLVLAFGTRAVANPKGLLSIAIMGGLYVLAEKPWKKRGAFAAFFAAGALLLKIIIDGPRPAP